MSFENVPIFLGELFVPETAANITRLFRFDSYVLDSIERRLLRGAESIPLTPKAFDTLEFLLRNAGHLVMKDELMSALWPDSFVDEGNIPRTIHTLRKVLGEAEHAHKYIETVPTKGYRFVAAVEAIFERTDGHGFVSDGVTIEDGDAPSLNAKNGADPHVRVDPATRSRSMRMWIAAAVFLTAAGVVGWFEKGRVTAPATASVTPHTQNGKAYQYFQLGKFYIERKLPGDEKLALDNFDRAIELDPNFAAAYAGRADARIWMFWTPSASHDNISIARAAVSRALELDDTSAYAHTLSCRIKATYDWDFAGAEKECRRAVGLDSGAADSHRELALLLNSVGRQDDALVEMDQALAIAPTSFNKRSRGVILYFSRRYDDAIEQLKQVEETDPEFEQCTLYLAKSYEMQRDWPEALEYYLKFRRKKATPAELESVRAGFGTHGWPSVLRDQKANMSANAFQYAGTLAQLGEIDAAFDALNESASRRRVMVVQTAQEPRFDPLKNDPRWGELMKRIGLD